MYCERSFPADEGFTLVELMITLLISGIISVAIYSTYTSQQRVYFAQYSVAEMQQNIRAALSILARDIRMAGYDPTGNAGSGFVDSSLFTYGTRTVTVTTSANEIAFTADLDGDGVIDVTVEDIDGNGSKEMTEMEQVAYRLNGTDLERFSSTTGIVAWQDIAENIEGLEFTYLDSDNNVTTTPADIRSVQISILARSGQRDPEFENNKIYTTASGAVWGPYNDGYRRRLLVMTVQCRNMGI
ncbi:PilW family protein [Desulfolithobacter sp.]